MELDGSVGLLY